MNDDTPPILEVDGEAPKAAEPVADEPATIPAADVPAAIAEWNEPPQTAAPHAIAHSLSVDAHRERLAAQNAHWAVVDTERMHGAVPHLCDGGLGDNPTIVVNEQITTLPFFDAADGLWGGVSVGDIVAYYPPGSATWWPATVVELLGDARARVAYDDRSGRAQAIVPHQASRKPGEGCWAHKNEEFTSTGRIAAELQLGIGGATYEEERTQAEATS